MTDTQRYETVFLIDDDMPTAEATALRLIDAGVQARVYTSAQEALDHRAAEPDALCAVNFAVADVQGVQFVREWAGGASADETTDRSAVIALVDAEPDGLAAIEAGAADFRIRPIGPDALAFAIRRTLDGRRNAHEYARARHSADAAEGWDRIVVAGAAMQDVVDRARRFARMDASVLIVGEAGTGRELIAHAMHRDSRYGDGPFLIAGVAGIPEERLAVELFGGVDAGAGLIGQAANGTLYLDGADHLGPAIQARLAAWLKETEAGAAGRCRLISSAVLDPQERAAAGLFREDLLHLMQEVRIEVSPLRQRKEEIPVLVRSFLDRLARPAGGTEEPAAGRSFEPGALEVLTTYDWPGNVRELEILVERVAVLSEGPVIRAADLPVLVSPVETEESEPLESAPRTSAELKTVKKRVREQAVARVERAFVLRALNQHGWNVTRAAKAVGMQRTNLQAMMRKYNVRRGSSS